MTAVVDLSISRIIRYQTKIAVGFEDEHWPWLASTDKKGYGVFRLSPQQCSKAHIFGFVLHHGLIPDGLHVDHICNLPWCQNPACWQLLTNPENNARSSSPSAVNARKTHCIRGHPFDIENTLVDKQGGRHCKACARTRGLAA